MKCSTCSAEFEPVAAGQTQCTSCMIRPGGWARHMDPDAPDPKSQRKAEAVSKEKKCEQPGCANTFTPGHMQHRRRYCDEHFIGKQGPNRKGENPKSSRPRKHRKAAKRREPEQPVAKPDADIQVEFGGAGVRITAPGISLQLEGTVNITFAPSRR